MEIEHQIAHSATYWEEVLLLDYEGLDIASTSSASTTGEKRKVAELTIEGKLHATLLNISRSNDLIIYIAMMTAYKIALQRRFEREKLFIGIPQYVKSQSESNNIFLVSDTSGIVDEKTVKKVLVDERKALNELYKHQFYPLADMYKIHKIADRVNAYCCMKNIHHEGLIQSILELPDSDLTLIIANTQDKITVEFYCSDVFSAEEVCFICNIYNSILNSMFENLEKKISQIDVVSSEERAKLLVAFNNNTRSYPREKTINALFEEQVEKSPANMAILSDGEHLTYKELNQRANALARTLKAKGVREETIVAVLVESSPEMIVGIMGVLKAGGAYLPLDPQSPVERISYMLADSNAKLLLTHQRTTGILGEVPIEQINLSDSGSYDTEQSNLSQSSKPDNLAYVIYTSGTTGRPKGVAVEHKGLINLCSWHNNYYNVSDNDVAAKYAGLGFDASVWEIFPYLIKGAAIYIVNEEVRMQVEALNTYYEEKGITIGFLPTSIFEQFVKLENKSLKRLLTGADKLRYFESKSYTLYNNYGPTEYSVVSTSIKLDRNYANIPIGKPIDNTSIYILDKQSRLVPIGLAGELCVSGEGIARGYLNNEELTREKFVSDPFKPGQRMYKTGDLARWLPDGNIEFLGRKDYQVKIRGFRIEPGEIENCLLNVQGVKEAVVLDKEQDGNKYLCAFYASSIDYTVSELREILLRDLPEYMIPSYFTTLPQLPLTPNGKINRKALLELDSAPDTGAEYVAPTNETERKLVSIWLEVLNLKSVGILHDFFELGGHSLKATVAASRIHQEFDVEVPLKEMFARRTIKSLAEYILSVEGKAFETIRRVAQQDYYEASSAQKRMYLLQQLDRDSVAYNMPIAIEIRGNVGVDKLYQTFNAIIARHDVLRANFDVIDDVIVQKIHDQASQDFKLEEMEATDEEDIALLFKQFIRPFDLKKDVLLRAMLLHLETERSILFFDIHHIIADGTSVGIFIKEFSDLYAGKELEPLKLQYTDYTAWHLEKRTTPEFKAQETFWLKEFEGDIPILNLPTDYQRPGEKDFCGSSLSVVIGQEVTRNLYTVARNTGCTLYMILVAALKVLLAKYSGQEDIVVGSPIAGRNHRDLENLMGMFVNTLAIRSTVDPKLSFKEYLATIREKALLAYEYQEYPFEELVEKLDLERSLNRNPLFDVLFVLQNADIGELKAENLTFKEYLVGNFVEKFDLTFDASERSGEIQLSISYATALFAEETIRRMAGHFINILNEISQNHEATIFSIKMTSDNERKCLLENATATASDYPKHKTIQQLFAEQAERSPRQIALVYQDKKLTYGEVNRKAHTLAGILRAKGVTSNAIVGIMAQRSPEMIIGILAILKAGGAYLPIDPEYPVERINYMLSDSRVRVLLTQQHLDKITVTGVEVVAIDDEALYLLNAEDWTDTSTPEDLAYVLYTSGTTGRPKGVLIKNKSVVNTLSYLQQQYPLGDQDSYLLKTNYTFDVSISELFGWFIGTGRLVILENGLEREPDSIVEIIYKHHITHINFTSSMLGVFLNAIDDASFPKIASLKYILTAGEALKFDNFRKVKKLMQSMDVENLYGPTEATIYATRFSLRDLKDDSRIPIGKPIQNTKTYILDPFNNLTPIGVLGELCIAGEGLAIGYSNNSQLTEEKFVDDPFEAGKKMYKTGDLARWLADGNIEYVGRMDHQVKIRGFRIELGEIEYSLLKLAGVREVIVIDRQKEGAKYLVAYYVTSHEYSIAELREHLKKSLPEYMVPSYFIALETMPLTKSGKIDRRVLPEVEANISSQEEYVAPQNADEQMLAEVWQEVLKIEKIGRNDDFFYLGGDSIKAIQIVSRVKSKGYSIEVKDIFRALNIQALSKHIKKAALHIDQGTVQGEVALTPIQKWFFENDFTDLHHWNQSVMLFKEDGFKEKILTTALEKLLTHHDALRMVFNRDAGDTLKDQKIHQTNRGLHEKLFYLEVHDLSVINKDNNISAVIAEICNNIQASIDLSNGPLVKAALFKTEGGDHLLIAIHHLVVDGVSWRILFEDLSSGYEQAEKGQEIVFPQKSTSFKVWADELFRYANSNAMQRHIAYWRNIEQKQAKPLPKDLVLDAACLRKTSSVKTVTLSRAETEILLKKTNHAYNTKTDDILLTALVKSMSTFSGAHSILLNLEGHGREEILKGVDVSRTVGWFTALYPVFLKYEPEQTLADLIKNVKDDLRRVPDKGIGYGLLKYLREQRGEEDIEFRLHPEICFNYLGQFDADITTSVFRHSAMDTGICISPENAMTYTLDFTGVVADGRLLLSLVYSSAEYEDKTMECLLQDYKDNLIAIIHHCANKQIPEVTAADITQEAITLQDLQPYASELNNIQEIKMLTPIQKGMLFHSMLDSQSQAYHESLLLHLEGEMDREVFTEAFKNLIERYEILRTNFNYGTFADSMQIVYKTRKPEIEYIDISHREFPVPSFIEHKVNEDRQRGFNLEHDALIRLTFIKASSRGYILIVSNHHILMDGWCVGIVLSDLFKLYNQLKTGQASNLGQVVSCQPYIEWIKTRDETQARDYWRKYLSGFDKKTSVPFERSDTDNSYTNSEHYKTLSREKVQRLEELVKHNKVTMNAVLQAVWAIQLQKYNNTFDAVFGYVVSGRNPEVESVENMIGLFINTIPLRATSSNEMTFVGLLHHINDGFMASQEYDDFPLADIQALSNVKNGLISSLMVFENYPLDLDAINAELARAGLAVTHFHAIEQTNYDLNLIISYHQEIHIKFTFNENKYSKEIIDMIGKHFGNIVDEIINNENVLIRDIDLIQDKARMQEIEDMLSREIADSHHSIEFSF